MKKNIDIATVLALKNDISIEDAQKITYDLFEIIKDNVLNDEVVSISNFGLFELKRYDKYKIKFKESKNLKDVLKAK